MARITLRHWGHPVRAIRTADALRRELGVDVELQRGNPGEFSVWVGDRKIVAKGLFLFPTDRKIVCAVRNALFWS